MKCDLQGIHFKNIFHHYYYSLGDCLQQLKQQLKRAGINYTRKNNSHFMYINNACCKYKAALLTAIILCCELIFQGDVLFADALTGCRECLSHLLLKLDGSWVTFQG